MKKFISMVMAAAMVASLVPATAFAANGTRKGEVTATAKVVDADILTKEEAAKPLVNDPYPEIQLKVTGVDYSKSDETDYKTFKQTVEVSLDKAHWVERPVMSIRLDESKGFVVEKPVGDENVVKVKTTKDFSDEGNATVTAAKAALLKAGQDWLGATIANDAAIGGPNNYKDAAALETANKATAESASDDNLAKALKTAKDALDAGTPSDPAVAAAKTALDDAKIALAAKKSEVAAGSTLDTAIGTAQTAFDTAEAAAVAAGKLCDLVAKYMTDNSKEATDQLEAGGLAALKALTGAGTIFHSLTTTSTFEDAVTAAADNKTAKISAMDTAEAALAAAKKALADAKAEIPALEADVTKKQAAYDEAVKNDSGMATLQAAYDLAKKNYDAAKAAYQAAFDALDNTTGNVEGGATVMEIRCVEWNDNSKRDDAKSWAKFEIYGKLHKDDVLFVDMNTQLKRTGEGTKATVSVDSDMCVADDLLFASVSSKALEISTRKLANVAEEEEVLLDDSGLKIVSKVGGFGEEIELKLSKGFEFVSAPLFYDREHDKPITVKSIDGNTMVIEVPAQFQAGTDEKSAVDDEYVDPKDKNEFTVYGIKVEATSAKSGATGTITAKSKGFDSAAVEVVKVVDYKVDLTVDEDEDIPVIYSGVNVDNYGITDDSDHWSVEVTAEETFPGAWSFRKGFNFELPEGVHVTDVDVVETDSFLKSYDTAKGTATAVTDDDVMGAFFDAYQEGSHLNFEFAKRVFDDVDATLSKDTGMMTFKLQLVADPTFEGDVVLKLSGELVDDQEVTIAKFVKPYTVKAEQNDIIIDYRYTDIPTAITITEAEKGLWAKNEATFWFNMERGEKNFMDFEEDPTFEIDSKSGMEIKNDGKNDTGSNIHFTVKTESDEAATINIKDIRLFMNRSIPAGPYDLTIGSSLENAFLAQQLFAPDCVDHTVTTSTVSDEVVSTHKYAHGKEGVVNTPQDIAHDDGKDAVDDDCVVDDIDDYSDVVKEAFVNVVTAGRDQDDASFTTKVVVPVGENYIVAGEKQIELDTPAYINAAGYTMLPIRAVAVALGINSNNVLWDQPTKTVTILYGQRIITMTQGQKVVYVNGSAIPASAAVENTNSRTFLPMRDLATALGVTDITWDQATRTATLNGNQK